MCKINNIIVKTKIMCALKHSDSKQLTLPLEVLKQDQNSEYLEIVKQNWKITFSRQYLASVHAKRVMGLIASQIREDGEIKEYYQITADKVIQETGLDKYEVYKRMKGVVYELTNIAYFIEDEETGRIVPRHLLDTTRFDNPAGYYNGMLTVAFNPHLNGIVNELAHYSKFELKSYVNFSSWYSMRLYELLYAYRDKTEIEWNIENYREWMGCGVELDREGNSRINKKTGKPKYIKYATHSNAIERTTREPIKEFKGTELEFKVFPVYATSVGRGRPAIEKVRFEFTWQKKSPYEKIVAWIEDSKDFERVYKRLKGYKVTDTIIVKYAKIIGKKKLNDLLHEWDVRQNEVNPKFEKILYPEKFCNKVIKDVAEQMIKEK